MEQVKENPWSEICWYMPESREQYRLSGKLYIIRSDEKDEQLKKVWHHAAQSHCHIAMLCMHSCCSNRCCDLYVSEVSFAIIAAAIAEMIHTYADLA